ncbi:MAG: hypothetical protein ACTHNS_06415 [Marmoricola sp.]
MARRIFLHIGAPKSGTTYLQDRLSRSRDVLAEHGMLLPQLRSGDHFEAALDLIERPWSGELERARGQWDVLAEQVRREPGDVIVSHEILAAARPEQVRRAVASFGDAELHVVLTARDLGRQLPAEWQEMVKHRNVAKFATFMRRVVQAPRTSPEMWFWRVQSLPDVLTRWGTGLTPDRIHVVTVPPPGAPADALWERFLGVLGLDPALPWAEAAVSNASLDVAQIAVVRRLNRRLRRAGVSRDTYVPFVRELVVRDVFGSRPAGVRPALPRAYREFVEEVTTEWLDWLEGSGIDVAGDPEDLRTRWPDTEPEARDPDRPRAGAVADAALDALAAVLIELDRGDPDVPPVTAALAAVPRRLGRRLRGS